MVLSAMSSFPSVADMLNRPHKLTFILRDVGKNPLKNIKYQIRDLHDKVVQEGSTDGQGQIKFESKAGIRLNLYLQPLEKGEMRKYKEFTIQSADGTVIWTTSLLVTETELKPERSAGEYWRGTYEVKRGDTLSDVAKRYGTRVSTLLELNPSIKDKDEISVGAILRVPPNKQSNDRNSERKNPPKPKQPVDETHGSTPSASSSVKSSQSDQIASNSSASSVQSRAAAPSASQGVSPHTNAQPRQVQQQKTTPNADSQTINKIESSNQDGNSVTTLTPECVCKKYDLIWGAKVSCAFRKKVVEISKRINCDPNDLMAVMAVETGRSFLPYQLSNKKGHSQPKSASEVTEQMVSERAVGLIQFTRAAVNELNAQLAKQQKSSVTKLKLAKMSAVEQLDYVELHIKTAADRLMQGRRLSLSDLYTSVFAPAHMGKSEDAVLYHAGTKAYSANRSVDIGDGRGGKPDGKITKAELAKRTLDIKQEGMSHHSNYSDHEGERVPTTATQAQTLKSEGASEKSGCKDGCSLRNSSALSAGDKKWVEPLDRMVLRTAALASPRGAMFGMTRNGGTKPHQGIDIVAEVGKTPVKAVAKGKITTVFSSSTYGNVVVLAVGLDDLPQKQKQAFEQYRTNTSQIAYFFYAHLHSINVQQNAEVSAGVQIAIAGNTGSTAVSCRTVETGSHLHFEVRDKDGIFAGMRNRLDPKYFLNIQYPRNFNP